jgi:DNA-binding response OmpR family regulator
MNDIRFKPDWDIPAAITSRAALRVFQPSDARIPVVIAEDDPISRSLVTAALNKGGFPTIVTNDGNEAMTAFRAREKACVAVVDWMMPGIDGPEVCRRLRESGKDVYIIMLTTRGGRDDALHGFDAGADDYMVKPFDREELLARVRTGIRQLTAHAALTARVQELEEGVGDKKLLKFQIAL